MKKLLSTVLAMTTVATMGITAFAQDSRTPETSEVKLSFGEEKFETMLLPGETYQFPLYITVDGKSVPVKDSHIEDRKFRTEVKSGKSALASFKVEEIDDIYTLEVQTEAGWPTKQSDVEGLVKLVKRSNGQVIGSANAEFTVGYQRIPETSLEAAKAEEYVYVDASAPVISTEQFKKLDKYAGGDKVTFTNGTWRYDVRVTDQKAVNMLHNERAIKEISTKFEDQNFKYVSFPAGPEFDFNGTLTIDVSEEMDDFNGNFYVYRYLKGVLTKIDATVDKDDESLSFATKNLGRFVITDKEIANNTVVQEGFGGGTDAAPETKPETKPEVKPETEKPSNSTNTKPNTNSNSNSSNKPSSDKPNPNTGAEDMVGIAVSAMALSLVGVGALAAKKSK